VYTVDLGELGDDADVLIYMADEALNVHCNFTGQEELLLVELVRHFLLERLVKELPEDDDYGKDQKQGEDKSRGGEELLLL
jgi:hypothetical protein